MPEKPLQVRLEAMDHRPGQFVLTFNSSQYPLTLNPEANVIFNDWLRRLQPVLMGKNDPAGELAPQALLRYVGTWLWQALLPDGASAQECETLAQALRTERGPLLLALPDALAGLPWELLCDPQQPAEQGFLARRRPLMRFHPSNTPVPSLPLPLRVLLLISSPPGLGEDSRVDVESERAAVEQATREAREGGLLHMLVEDIVTPRRVQQALVRFKPHILHYIGHGGFDEQSGGVLLWEDDQGNELPLSDAHLADILRPRNLHAVVLHACETGRSNARTNMRSIAGTLVHEGIPAVIAQQANFSYESSQRASEAWYTALTAGQGFAEALFEVRQALSQADRPDWAVPILQGSTDCLAPLLDDTALPGTPDPQLTSRGAAADLPAPTGVFVGRHRELRELRLMLENVPGNGPVLALITGPGGVGKSTLAALAVTRSGGKYKAALTLSCQGYQSGELFLQRIGEFLKRLGEPGFLEQRLPDPKLSMEAKIEEAIAALNSIGPVLLVVDNLENVQTEDQTLYDASLLHLLQKLLTNLHGGRVLIIGRYAVNDLLPHGKFAAYLLRLNLDDLSPYETTQLLMRHPTLTHLGEAVRETLIREFGGLPYVYDLLSSNAASLSLDLLIHDVQNRITQKRKQRSTEEWREVRRQVVEFAALDVTISRLAEPSRVLLAQLSVLHQACPFAAIEQGLGAARTAWQPLLDWSLLRYDSLERVYHLHSLTRRYAEGLLEEQHRQQAQEQLAIWYIQYATGDSHKLEDYLEAHRLLREAGNVKQAGNLVMQLTEVLKGYGLYPLLRNLWETTLKDMQARDEPLAANALHYLGKITHLQGEYEEARCLYQQSLEMFERLGYEMGRAGALRNLGNIALRQGEYEEARRLYQQGLEIIERQGNQDSQASTLYELGTIALRQGEYEEARRLYQQSLNVFERLGDQHGRANALHNMGHIALLQGEYEEARRLYQQGLEIYEQLGDQHGRVGALRSLGNIAQDQGEYEEARRLYQQSLNVFEWLGDRHGQAEIQHELGNIAFLQREYKEARHFSLRSLEIHEQLGVQREQAINLYQLGNIAQEQREYEEARRLYQQSLNVFERLGDQRGQAGIQHELGNIAFLQREYEEARHFYLQSLEIKERLGNQVGQAVSLQQLGLLAYEQGNLKDALMYTAPAYILFNALRSPYRDTTLRILARIRSHMDEVSFTTQWQMLAGNHPLPTLSNEGTQQPLLQVVIDFLNASTWDSLKRFLELHLELLQPEIDVLLQELAMQQEQDGARKIIEEHRLLLAKCRDKGIDAVFAERQSAQSPEMTFTTKLDRICAEVVTTLLAKNAAQQEALAIRLEQMLEGNLPMVGALDFLQVLVAWLREQDTQTLEKKLRPPFNAVYAQMAAAVGQEERDNADTDDILTIEDLRVISSVMLQGTEQQRQQIAIRLTEGQEQLPPEEASFGRFLGCLAAALRGETPEVALLEAPFTDLWQEFQDALSTPSGE